MRARLSSVQAALLRSIRNELAATEPGPDGPPSLVIEGFAGEPWASLTFTGIRHRLDLRIVGHPAGLAAAAKGLERLLEAGLPSGLAGHFLADSILLIGKPETDPAGCLAVRLSLDVLTIEE